ncbi:MULTISPECIES: ribonuclease III [Comamonas]|uniref:Ribonuclease 3 n=1 Tax=Comamonas avium TaxID=2762231 RepID=A0ABR8SB35_9BURK|nr:MULTISPECIES: ribonuclease III [Comamonas]MBD7960697.1 ribonuclease III [Comamonas avium]MBD9401535.1 ribonuclease III [Comamonas sp. CMM02]
MPITLQDLQQQLQHDFQNPALLQRALTHRSFSADNNERLEFLGDSVLSLAISSLLYQRLRELPEGDLSRVRSNLVKEGTLHQIAVKLQLSDLLRLGEGEAKSGGKNRPSILADAVEAILGAVYLDAGFAAGEKLVHRLFEGVDINPHMRAAEKDPKTALQEWLQGRRMNVPQYSVANITGAAHKQTFDVECVIPELRLGARGQGGSRRIGEQAAAAAMLEILKAKHP